MRVDHDPQRRVLQVQQLRQYERVRVETKDSGFADHED
jgi:hypothetical protein